MRRRLSSLLALSLAFLAATAAEGQATFSNFPVNGQISAFQVNAGYSASNSFTLPAGATIGEVSFGAWVTTGDSVASVAWAIGTMPYDTSLGSGVAAATSAYDLSNVDGFDVVSATFATSSLTLPAGTYYLTLSSAVSAAGKPVYWDINDGPGVDAWDTAYGHVSSANTCFLSIGISGTCASSFQLLSTGTSLAATPASVAFPNQTVSTSSAAQGVTITNNGTGPASISGIAIAGANAADFAQTNTCPISPATLAASASCAIQATFTPQAVGARSANVILTGSSPLSLPLTGAGVLAPSTVTLLPSSLTFPNQTVSTASGTQTVTVTNSGPSPLTVSGISIAGTNNGDFSQTNNCPAAPAAIAVNSSCLISVTFTPQAAGARSAFLSIADNGSGSPQSVTLGGTGVAAVPTTWPNGYKYQATFTVAPGQVPSAQTNFPALISGTFADFASAANGGRISNTCTQTVGNGTIAAPCDLIFTSDAAGTALLNWEFESWTAATGAVNIWVNVPTLATGTVVYAWYGQPSVTTLQTVPTATWTNSLAVYHLKENPAGAAPQLNDSTGNGNNAAITGPAAASQQQPGEIGGSINFEGNTWASVASTAAFSFERTDSFSLSGWFNLAGNSTETLLAKFPAVPNSGWALLQEPGAATPTIALGLFGAGNAATFTMAHTPSVTLGAWHYVVATYAGTSTVAGMNIYIDGVKQTLTTLSNNLSTTIVNNLQPTINSRATASQISSDSMDELRISAKGVVLTPAWVTATFHNQSKPGTFFTAVTGLTPP